MSYKSYDFLCTQCKHIFNDLIKADEGPDPCPICGATSGFVRQFPAPAIATQTVPVYPGSKRVKAGYQHTHNRPAEKAATQVSLFQPKK